MTATYHGRYRRTCCPTTDCAPRRLLPGSTSPFSECIPFGFPLGHPPCLYFSSRIALTLVFPHRDSSPTWPMNKNSRVTLGRVATYRPDLGSGAVGPVSLGDPRVLLLIGLSGRPVLGGKTTLLWLQVPFFFSHGAGLRLLFSGRGQCHAGGVKVCGRRRHGGGGRRRRRRF